jgi:hypothetical protein
MSSVLAMHAAWAMERKGLPQMLRVIGLLAAAILIVVIAYDLATYQRFKIVYGCTVEQQAPNGECP